MAKVTLKRQRELLKAIGIHNDYDLCCMTNGLAIRPEYTGYMQTRFHAYLITQFKRLSSKSYSKMEGLRVEFPGLRGSVYREEKAAALSDAMKQAGGEWEKSPFDFETYHRAGTVERALDKVKFTDAERGFRIPEDAGSVRGVRVGSIQ